MFFWHLVSGKPYKYPFVPQRFCWQTYRIEISTIIRNTKIPGIGKKTIMCLKDQTKKEIFYFSRSISVYGP